MIPQARIFSYGYDAKTHGSGPLSVQTIPDLGKELVVDLISKRLETNVSMVWFLVVISLLLQIR